LDDGMIDQGRPAADVLAELDGRRAKEPSVHGGRLFGLVYPTGRDDLEELLVEVNNRYLFGNALNPFKFPELAALETEVVGMVGDLVNLPTGGGCMTSGGTESILMSMLVNRERARAKGIEQPEIVVPQSAHPAYAKAAHYFGMKLVHVPLDNRYRADVSALTNAINPNTAVVVASAFSYPFGIMDPVEEIAAIAQSMGVGCHVDACIGSFVLPFLERLDQRVPAWDFRVEGVTEMSCDVHKYGYCPKGASVVLHRDPDWFLQQGFVYEDWPSGLYGSAAIAGARPAAPIATAWAVLNFLGVDGYVDMTRQLMDVVGVVRAAVDSIEGLDVIGLPIGPVMAIRSDTHDIYAIGDVMDDRGWHLNRNRDPESLHLMLSPVHASVADELVRDLRDAVANHGERRGSSTRYS
jgi:glutamate/tyrosine decarboxylase-like PLP-dependent enzyme